MNAISAVLSSAWVERVGWMLVHSVWEITAISILYGLVLALLPRGASAARYTAGTIALLCMILVLPATLALVGRHTSSEIAKNQTLDVIFPNSADHPTMRESAPVEMSHKESYKSEHSATVNRAMIESLTQRNREASWQTEFVPLLPWLTTIWFAGVVLFSLRLLVGLAGVERLRRVGITDARSEIGKSGSALATRLGIRRAVKFAESALVQVPTVIGYLRPVVLLPAVPLTGLSTREIEFLLAHELAHIRRHDYLHNIVQGVIETMLFYHPAMWWVSSCVRRERENCCDDLVVSTLESPIEYAKTLFTLEQRRSIWRPSLAASDGRLLERIRRLIGSPVRTSLSRQWGKGFAGFIVLVLVSVPIAATVQNLAAQNEARPRAEKEKTGDSAKDTTKAGLHTSNHNSTAPTFVRIVVGPNKKLTFEGAETNWDGVEALLEKVPARANTVLEVAISTEDVSVREMNDAVGTASHYGRQFGFKYTSYIGVHPFGSKGTRPQAANEKAKSSQLATDAAKSSVGKGVQSHHLAFTPRHGMANRTNWTDLVVSHLPDEKPHERLTAQVTLEGEFPVTRQGDKKPLFNVKLLAGSDDSLNIKLTSAGGESYNRILHRGKPLSWKLNGKTYWILYPETNVALDQPAESPFASITITCRIEAADNEADSSKEKKKPDADSGAHKDTDAPDESSEDSKGHRGSDMLRNIHASAAPILAELAAKHGYALANGQAIRRVSPPFPKLRMTYYRIAHPSQSESMRAGPEVMTFRWNNGELQGGGMTFGAGGGFSLSEVVDAVIGIKPPEIEGPKNLLAKKIPGDWVIRTRQPDEVVVEQLEKILREEWWLPVRLEFRRVEREVYVARGDYRFTPMPGRPDEEKVYYTDNTERTDPVDIFGGELVPNSGNGGGTGDFAEFLQWLSRWIDARVVDEVNQRPHRHISWTLHGHSPGTDDMRKKDHDAELVLQNIAKQTNLRFSIEKRPVRVLSVRLDEGGSRKP
jgi:beta-lactamase regulating signal transducer with metallopeptidase domain